MRHRCQWLNGVLQTDSALVDDYRQIADAGRVTSLIDATTGARRMKGAQ
jgi:hypothetical protein